MARRRTTRERDILRQLDEYAEGYDFPTLDNGYIYPVDVRLTAYRDNARWALVIEHIGYSNRAYEFQNILYVFGDCLPDDPGHGPAVPLVDTPEADWQDETGHVVNPGLRSIQVRGVDIPLTPELRQSVERRAGRQTVRDLPIWVLFRRLLPLYRDLFFATEAELRGVVPADLLQLLRLYEWEHSDAVRDVLPSHTECFPMLAKVLATGDVTHYQPTRPPNTHWTNWPAGGTL